MAVRFSGPALSSLYFEHCHCQGDQEGLLLGQTISRTTDSISDSQINNTKEETTMYVFNYIHCNSLFTWYDSAGQVIPEQLKQLVSKHIPTEVIGWYKMRRQSTLSASLRELVIHRNLQKAFGIKKDQFLFCLFTSAVADNQATHSMKHKLHCSEGIGLKQVSMNVTNLEDTAHSDYKFHCSPSVETQPTSIFAKAIELTRGSFEHGSDVKEVVRIKRLNGIIQTKLTKLRDDVGETEEQVDSLRKEVQHLRAKFRRLNELVPYETSTMPVANIELSVRSYLTKKLVKNDSDTDEPNNLSGKPYLSKKAKPLENDSATDEEPMQIDKQKDCNNKNVGIEKSLLSPTASLHSTEEMDDEKQDDTADICQKSPIIIRRQVTDTSPGSSAHSRVRPTKDEHSGSETDSKMKDEPQPDEFEPFEPFEITEEPVISTKSRLARGNRLKKKAPSDTIDNHTGNASTGNRKRKIITEEMSKVLSDFSDGVDTSEEQDNNEEQDDAPRNRTLSSSPTY